jgi:hypothetical protein
MESVVYRVRDANAHPHRGHDELGMVSLLLCSQEECDHLFLCFAFLFLMIWMSKGHVFSVSVLDITLPNSSF